MLSYCIQSELAAGLRVNIQILVKAGNLPGSTKSGATCLTGHTSNHSHTARSRPQSPGLAARRLLGTVEGL
jgi:hypothetical protein